MEGPFYERMADDVRAIQRRINGIRATVDSVDGLITATVGGRGELVELTIDPRVFRSPDSWALAAAITTTVHQAVELAQGELFTVVQEFLPADATLATTDLAFDPLLTQLDRKAAR